MSMDKTGSHYFISYSRTDSDFVTQFASDLRESGVDVWIDTRDIEAGSEWDDVIEDALRTAVGVIVIVTPESNLSQFVKKEIIFSQNHHKPIFPVLVQETEIPLLIADLQTTDFSVDYSRGFNQLTGSLKKPQQETGRDDQKTPSRRWFHTLGNFSLKRALTGLVIGAVYGAAITIGLSLSGGGIGALLEGTIVYGVLGALAALIIPRTYRALTLFTGGFLVCVIALWVWTMLTGKNFNHVLVIGPIIGGLAGALFSRIVVSIK